MITHVTYIISDIDKALAFEWIAKHIDKQKFNLSFILINSEDSDLKKYLERNNFLTYTINCSNKKQIIPALCKCFLLLKKIKPDVVHCHLMWANLIGLTGAKLAGVRSRIYTRHHSDYHHIYFPKAVKWDKYCNKLATKIVSITDVVTDILVKKENVSENKIIKIWHGFDTDSFVNPVRNKVTELKAKYNPYDQYPVIGVISRFTHWKGVQYIIPSYKKILEKYPNALLLMFNCRGEYENEINRLLEDLPFKSYKKVLFEQDIASLYHIFDVFIHVPISASAEAFGQTYIECMLSGIPLIATKSGVADEILTDKYNSLIVPYKDSKAIFDSIMSVLENQGLREQIVSNSFSSVLGKFDLKEMIYKLEMLYLS